MNDYLKKTIQIYDNLRTYGRVVLFSIPLLIGCRSEKPASELEQRITAADSSAHTIHSRESAPQIMLTYDSTNVGSDTTDNKRRPPQLGLAPLPVPPLR